MVDKNYVSKDEVLNTLNTFWEELEERDRLDSNRYKGMSMYGIPIKEWFIKELRL